MNEYFKRGIRQRQRDTKWLLCPLHKAVSHAAAGRKKRLEKKGK